MELISLLTNEPKNIVTRLSTLLTIGAITTSYHDHLHTQRDQALDLVVIEIRSLRTEPQFAMFLQTTVMLLTRSL